MVNRKGFFLAEEALKIIIALISLSFLVYFLTALYFSNQTSEEFEFAEASLTNLINGISSEVPSVEVYNPEGWILNSFSSSSESIPSECEGFNGCICFCDNNDCSDELVCMESEFNVQEGIEIENPPVLLGINYEIKEITSNGP